MALHLVIQDWTATADTLSGTDDDMRRVELRAFLAGQGWFDLHDARIALPFGNDPHGGRA